MVPESISLTSITENSKKKRKWVCSGRLHVTKRPLQDALVSKKDNLSFLFRVVFSYRIKSSSVIMHLWKTKKQSVVIACKEQARAHPVS